MCIENERGKKDEKQGIANIVKKTLNPNTVYYFLQDTKVDGQRLYEMDNYKEWFSFCANQSNLDL